MPAEAASVLRRATLRGEISVEVAAIANADLLDLSIELYAFEKYAFRVWQLRDNLPVYDAWYVALAESLEASLATLDQRLATATGPTCEFVTPP